MFSRGTPVRKSYLGEAVPQGFAQGANVSFDTTTTFTVSPGSLYINGKYRSNSATVTVPSTADDPANGLSGAVTTIGASATNNVYAVADQDSVKTFSISYGTATTGLTNYRKIGSIKTDINSHFTSRDFFTIHSVNNKEVAGGWVRFDGTGTININDAYNVASLTDNGTGDYTITWDTDFSSVNYAVAGMAYGATCGGYLSITAQAVGTIQIINMNTFGLGAEDSAIITLIALGDQ